MDSSVNCLLVFISNCCVNVETTPDFVDVSVLGIIGELSDGTGETDARGCKAYTFTRD